MNKGAEIERLRSIADNNAANGLAAEERVEELEAERDRVMRENGKLNCHIDDLEAERDRLEERLGDWQRETALAKADRDKLREALIKESEYQMGNYGSCAEWITKALEKTP